MQALPMVFCLLFTTVASVLFDSQEHVCEFGNLTISCAHSPNTTIYITCANYGRTSHDTCYDRSATSKECIGRNSLLIATGLCQNRVSCTVVANNTVFGDPCNGVSKYLELGYECRESEPEAYECHGWTAEDKAQMNINCTHHPELQKPTCEGHLGFVFAEGNDTLAPGCGNCSCCKPADPESYQCHDWTYEDKSQFWINCTYHGELERPTCERHPGFVYAQGNETMAPGCGSCFCCKPTVSAKSVCPERSTTLTTLSQTTQSSIEVTPIPNSSPPSTNIVGASTHTQTHGSLTIDNSSGFFDDPTNIAAVSTAAGVVGIGALFVTGYVLVSNGNRITSFCSKTSTSVQPA